MSGTIILLIVICGICRLEFLHNPIQSIIHFHQEMDMVFHQAESNNTERSFRYIRFQHFQKEKVILIIFKQNLFADSTGDHMVIPADAFYSRCSGHDSHPFDISIDGCSDELKANKTKKQDKGTVLSSCSSEHTMKNIEKLKKQQDKRTVPLSCCNVQNT